MSNPFDEIIDRSGINALAQEGYKTNLFPDSDPASFRFSEEDLLPMWVADMAFATPDVILEGIKKRLDRRVLGYTQVFDPQYYAQFAKWTERHYGWHCSPNELVTSNGVIPALHRLVDLLCKPMDQVLIITPSYAPFKTVVEAHKCIPVYSDLIKEDGYFRLDFNDLEEKMADPGMKLCLFCHPHNPTGRAWTEEELKHFTALLRTYDLWVVSDEIHCDLLRKGKRHTPLALYMGQNTRCVTCMSPSKTFNLAGMMLSNIVIPDDALRRKWKEKYRGPENPLSIAAVQTAYQSGDAWLKELRAYLDDNFFLTAHTLQNRLPKAVFRIPEATYLAWIDLGAYFTPEVDLPLLFAREAGVLLEGGDMFVRNAEGHIRLNVACPRSELKKALDRVCDCTLQHANRPGLSFPKT